MVYNKQCDPLQNNVNFPKGPPLPGMPGFGLDINFPTIPFPDLGIPEDILNWLRRLKFNLPGGGLLQEYVDKLTKSVASILSNLLAYLNVFIGYLMFAMAIIEMILCIIKVLCALPKPWSVIRAVKRLLRKCIPIFISICFPFFAWLLLLLSLIELLLALIEYIIAMIIRLIKQILKNLNRIKNLIKSQRAPNAALAVLLKVANFLCLFQVIFEFLSTVLALFDLITGQWTKVLKVCDNGPAGGADDDSVCAAFMKNPTSMSNSDPETWISRVGSSKGNIVYCNAVFGLPFASIFPPFPVTTPAIVRNETIYLQDDTLDSTLTFNNIITSGGFTFFPFDKTITKDIDDKLKPYLLDLFITMDPGDGYGSRKIEVDNVTVTNIATTMTTSVVASIISGVTDNSGVLMISGGKVANDPNPTTNGKTLDTLLHKDTSFAAGGAIIYSNIQYSLKINFEALAEYNLITMDCFPSIGIEKGILNATFNKAFNFTLPDFVTLPDVSSAINGLNACMQNYRSNITIDTTNVFGNCMLNIMNDLSNQAANTLCQLLMAAMDIYNMPFIVTPALQFTNIPIKLQVTPADQAGRTIPDLLGSYTPIPQSCLDTIASKFVGEATLGTVSPFSYDGYGNFVADINSSVSGDGYVNILYDGNMVKQVLRSTDPSVSPIIEDLSAAYTFVGITESMPAVRRDETDTANNNQQ